MICVCASFDELDANALFALASYYESLSVQLRRAAAEAADRKATVTRLKRIELAVNHAARLIDNGWSASAAAEVAALDIDVRPETVLAHVRRRQEAAKRDLAREVAALAERGLTGRQIAARLGLGKTKVYQLLKKRKRPEGPPPRGIGQDQRSDAHNSPTSATAASAGKA